jgi:hypothetical protein
VYSKIAQDIGDSVDWPEGMTQLNTHSKQVMVYPIHMGKSQLCGHFYVSKTHSYCQFLSN